MSLICPKKWHKWLKALLYGGFDSIRNRAVTSSSLVIGFTTLPMDHYLWIVWCGGCHVRSRLEAFLAPQERTDQC